MRVVAKYDKKSPESRFTVRFAIVDEDGIGIQGTTVVKVRWTKEVTVTATDLESLLRMQSSRKAAPAPVDEDNVDGPEAGV
jgi:hypothetical protein